jgi:hypothetical protein
MTETELPTYTNIQTSLPNTIRLKWSMILKDVQANPNTKHIKKEVNWEFWQKQLDANQNFNIYIDELHNVLDSRMSMSTSSVKTTHWISQIRKIMGQSEKADFLVVSQGLDKIDKRVYGLAHEIIYCKKQQKPEMIMTKCLQNGRIINKLCPLTHIITYYFRGEDCVPKYLYFKEAGQRTYDAHKFYFANPYFKYYDSYQIVDFGESEYV